MDEYTPTVINNETNITPTSETSESIQYISNEELRNEILQSNEIELLDKFKEQNSELCSGRTDAFLMLFIWARKLDLERAAALLKKNLELRKKYDLDNLNMKWIKELLSTEVAYGPQIAGVECNDIKGRPLSFILPINMTKMIEPTKDKDYISKMTHYSWWTIERIFFQKKFINGFREGVVYLEDFKDVSLMKMMGFMDRNVTKELMENMQDCLPLRIRMIYLYNFPMWMRVLIAIVKPFMKKKLRKKIQVLVTREDLRQVVADKDLIKELGGELDFSPNKWVLSAPEFQNL